MVDEDDILTDSRKEDETLDKLHGTLPDDVDRRRFFKGALGLIVGGGLAGCAGSGGNGGGGTEGTPTQSDTPTQGGGTQGGGEGSGDVMGYPGDIQEVVFRNSYKDKPYEAHGYIARGKNFWRQAGIKPPVVKTGQGSGNTTQRIGTGKEEYGIANIQAQIQGQAEGMTHKVLCGAKSERAMLTLLYRKDMLPSANPEDLRGSTILTASAFDQQTLKLYLEEKGISMDEITMNVAENTSQFALVAQEKAPAMWGQITQIETLRQNLPENVEVGVDLFYKYQPIYGYMAGASEKVLQAENGREYTKRMVEGLSAAGKWCMFNPEKVVEYIIQNVNSALQTRPDEAMMSMVKASLIGPCLIDEVVDEGVFWINPEVMQRTYNFTENAYDVDAPDPEEGVAYELLQEAELSTLTQSEYDEAYEIGQPYTGFYGRR